MQQLVGSDHMRATRAADGAKLLVYAVNVVRAKRLGTHAALRVVAFAAPWTYARGRWNDAGGVHPS
jgi:hypothetical protein